MSPHLKAQSLHTSSMIIAYLGRNVKDYCKNYLRYLEELELICPGCGNRTVFYATYKRHVRIEEAVEWLIIHRVICKACKRTHAVIPDFIRPYKHYSAYDSEMSLRDIDNGIPVEQVETVASVSTLRRWAAEFQEKSHQAAGALKALLFNLYNKTVNELELYRLKLFETLEKILKEFPEIESNNLLIGDLNIWFTNKMAGMFI